jgi:hypothetical protein
LLAIRRARRSNRPTVGNMPKSITDLLHRRSDLSTFLVHLTRNHPDHPARSNLLAILTGRTLEARTPMGVGSKYWEQHADFAITQKPVCFSETPLEHVWMLCEEIAGRTVQMQPYGLAITKTWARRHGVNPIMYIDQSPTGFDWLLNPVNEMLDAAAAGHAVRKVFGQWQTATLAQSPIARLTPFFEPMDTALQTQREWWWEREWRHIGNLGFEWHELVAVLVPEDDHLAFLEAFNALLTAQGIPLPAQPPHLLDPRWGQERMIAALAGVPADSVGPFP